MPKTRPNVLTARTSDKQRLYEMAVQCPEAEINFVTREFQKATGRPLRTIREDFCGTALSACEFVNRHAENRAIGLDLHKPTLAWGTKNNLSKLKADARERITLLPRDVRTPGREGSNVDAVLAMNFSYWYFKTREELRNYFATVCQSLAKDGVLFMDACGGWECQKPMQERRSVTYAKGQKYKYVWDQGHYNPITGETMCYIHFEFEKGPAMKRAFTYDWRLWTLPEIREILIEAGFKKVTVFWEGTAANGHGNGVFRPSMIGEACASWIVYISAEKAARSGKRVKAKAARKPSRKA